MWVKVGGGLDNNNIEINRVLTLTNLTNDNSMNYLNEIKYITIFNKITNS